MKDLFKKWVKLTEWDKVIFSEEAQKELMDFAKYALDNRWVSVDTALPEFGLGSLICLNTGLITVAYRKKKRGGYNWQLFGDIETSLVVDYEDYVTHWQPLPNPPKPQK